MSLLSSEIRPEEIVKILDIPLAYYIYTNQDELVKTLVTRDTVNRLFTNQMPLYYAALYGKWNIFCYFLDIGADINECRPTLITEDCDMYSCRSGFILDVCGMSMIRNLLDKNIIDVNYKGDSCMNTPLLIAASNGSIKIVRYLVDRGDTNIFYNNDQNLNALELAAINGHYNVVIYLLKRGLVYDERIIGHLLKCENDWCETIDNIQIGINDPIKICRHKYQKYRALTKVYYLLRHNTFRLDYLDHKYRTLKKIGYLSQFPRDVLKLIVNFV